MNVPESFINLMIRAYSLERESRERGAAFGIMPMDTGGYSDWVNGENWFEVPVAHDGYQDIPKVWSLRMTPGLSPSRWPVARCGFISEDSTTPVLCSSLAEIPAIYAALFESSTDYYQEVQDFHEAFREDRDPLANILSLISTANLNNTYNIAVDGSAVSAALLNTMVKLCAQFDLLKGSLSFWQSLYAMNDGSKTMPGTRTETHWPEFLNLTCYRLYFGHLSVDEKIQLLTQMLLFDSPRYQGGLAEFALDLFPGMFSESSEQFRNELTAELRTLQPKISKRHPYAEFLHLICTIDSFASYDGSLHLQIARALAQSQQYVPAFDCLQVATFWGAAPRRQTTRSKSCEIELALELAQETGWRDIRDAIHFNLNATKMI